MEQSFYDLLVMMQKNLDNAQEQTENDVSVCIMDALGVTQNDTCKKLERNCESCIQDYLNSFPF